MNHDATNSRRQPSGKPSRWTRLESLLLRYSNRYLSLAMDTVKDSLTQGYNTAKRALSTAPPNDAYLQWDAPGVEEIKADEDTKAQQIADTMNKMQKHNFDKVSRPTLHLQPTLALRVTSTVTPFGQHMSKPKA